MICQRFGCRRPGKGGINADSRFLTKSAKWAIFWEGKLGRRAGLKSKLFLNQSSVDGHLGCFQFLAIVNSAAMNIGVPVSFWISVFVFSKYIPRSGIAESHGIVLVPCCFLWCLHQFTFPPTVHKGSLFSTSSPVFCYPLYVCMYVCMYVCIYLFIYLFIYLGLHWVFVAAHGLFLVAASGSYSSLRCTCFSLRWLLLLRSTGFSSRGTQA